VLIWHRENLVGTIKRLLKRLHGVNKTARVFPVGDAACFVPRKHVFFERCSKRIKIVHMFLFLTKKLGNGVLPASQNVPLPL